MSMSPTNTELLELGKELQQKVKRLEDELFRTRADLEAVETALRLLRVRHNIVEPTMTVKPQDLVGMTYLKAITTIAEANDGKLRVAEATKLLQSAGIVKNPKTAYQQVTATILRSKRFDRHGPGVYVLKERTVIGDSSKKEVLVS